MNERFIVGRSRGYADRMFSRERHVNPYTSLDGDYANGYVVGVFDAEDEITREEKINE